IPASLTLLSVTPSSGSCSGSTTVVCDFGNLPAGSLATISVNVHANSTGPVTDTATLSTTSPDSNPANNTATTAVSVIDPCAPGGAGMATDPSGDQGAGTSQQDLRSVAVGEPFLGAGVNKLRFTLKADNLTPAPQPNSYWYEYFSYGGRSWFVD